MSLFIDALKAAYLDIAKKEYANWLINSNRTEICNDGVDNDGDNYADCADIDCIGQYGPNGGPCEIDGETFCSDGEDNDGDGKTDCDDSSCMNTTLCKCWDKDGDGFSAGSDCGTAIDCDNEDSSVYPGAKEIPGDGKDQNCDGNLKVYYSMDNGGSVNIDISGAKYNESCSIDDSTSTMSQRSYCYLILKDDGTFILRVVRNADCSTSWMRGVSCDGWAVDWSGIYAGGSTSGSLTPTYGHCAPDYDNGLTSWSGTFDENQMTVIATFEAPVWGTEDHTFTFTMNYTRDED